MATVIKANKNGQKNLTQSHRTKLPYFRNELVEKSVNGQNWQTGQSYFLAIYVYKNLKSSLHMMAFYKRIYLEALGFEPNMIYYHDLLFYYSYVPM